MRPATILTRAFAILLATAGIGHTAEQPLPTLFLAGDSTVKNGGGTGADGLWGWGGPLAEKFDPAKLLVRNMAKGGTSSRTFLTQGLWEKLLLELKPGDMVLIQFGHNDSGPLDDTSRARGTLKGIGPETRDIFNPITKAPETVHTYGWYLRKFVTDVKEKGATAIVCSPVPRKIWKEGKIEQSTGSYAGWAATVAREEGVGFLDLNRKIAQRYDALGAAKVETLFGDEHTHTNREGAEINADVVLEELEKLEGEKIGPAILHRP